MRENSTFYWDNILQARVDNSALVKNKFIEACLSDIPKIPFNIVDQYLATVCLIHGESNVDKKPKSC